ncbi:MAG TPA: phosphate signaling complex protein PhoU [Candidatus Acidoferrales bacterium]|jgi:phosphate transport system protein|nr:phosphate signaling complex protein PhoU [Candidatus Acidoferrales bacterium]
MDSNFEKDLNDLREKILKMGSYAEAAARQAVQSLIQRDRDLALRVKENDQIIDQLEVEIDDFVVQQLTKAPLATDLRLVTAAIKMSHDLERIGDEATQIAKRAIELCLEPAMTIQFNVPQMTILSFDMLKASLDAFANRDPVAARAVIPRDKEVDALNKAIHQTLAQHMVEHPDTIKRCLHWMVVSKSVERIADHATNIAENVVYLYEGQDIRHTGIKFGK